MQIFPFFQGVGIGAGLIIAIGAQNSYVLSQGIKKQNIFIIPLICALCDIILIFAGAAGIGTFVAAHPDISYYAGLGGALFLIWYGFRSLKSALYPTYYEEQKVAHAGIKSVILTTLALSLLNPHVYLDTLVLLGTISGQFDGFNRYSFAFGASVASLIWFFALSYGSTLLGPLFKKPLSWKILDFCICIVMWSLAYSIWPGIEISSFLNSFPS